MLNSVLLRIAALLSAALLLYLSLTAPNSPARQSAASSPQGFHEDWKSITVESSALQPQKPVVLEKTDLPGGKSVRVRVRLGWRPADVFDLYIALPKGVTKPPVILYLYSFPETAARFKSDHWFTGTVTEGYAAVGFVSALTGERADQRPPDEWFVGQLQESLVSSVHDVQMILDYLNSRGDLDMNRVGMFGTGSGGAIAILASAADPRIKAIDILNPWADWPSWLAKSTVIPDEQRDKYLDPAFREIIAPLDPVLWLPKVKAQSVRIQNVRQEATVPLETQKKIEDAAPSMAEINQFGDYRILMSMEPGSGIFSWLRGELQPNASLKIAADKPKRVHFFPSESKSIESTPAQP